MTSDFDSWKIPTIILCLSGFFHAFNPSEPYLTPYLMGPRKNFTGSECVNQIYPVWSYSYLAFLVPVFLLTDYLKYKPVIIVEGLCAFEIVMYSYAMNITCYIGCWLLLLFGTTLVEMQIMQVFFGMATASQIGFYSYIYSIVAEEQYQRVTSYTRAVVLFGLFLGAALAQILVSLINIDFFYLNIIAFVNICIGFIVSLFLPMPNKTLFFFAKHLPDSNTTEPASDDEVKHANTDTTLLEEQSRDDDVKTIDTKLHSSWKAVLTALVRDAKVAYSNHTLLRWSLWWALSTCGYMLVVNYVQNLWETIYSSADHGRKVYNGAVEAFATVLGAAAAFAVGFMRLDWAKWGEWVLGTCSICKCALLVAMYVTKNIWLSYGAYVFYIFLYNLVITITQFQLAVGLSSERVALVFGINTFMAVALNMALTLIVIDDVGLGMDVKTLFIVYSAYFGVLSVLFLGHAIYVAIWGTSVDLKIADEEQNEI